MKRVLITGASGLLGSNTVAALLKSGYDVRAMIRRNSRTTALGGLDVEHVYGDLSDEASIYRAVRGCQVVVHAAANTRQRGGVAADYQRDNIDAVDKISAAVLQNGVERFIFVSTANVFQPGDASCPGDETTAVAPALSDSLYISSKIEAERLILEKVRREHLPAIIVNPTFMIGPRDAQPSSGRLLLHGLRNGIIVCPAGGKNFIDVRDVAAGIVAAITSGRIGQNYLLANENLSYAGFFEKVAEVAGMRKHQLLIPPGVLSSAARLGEVWKKCSGRQPPLTNTNALLLNRNCYYTGAKAVRELGLPQTPIESAIAAAVEWFALFNYWQPPGNSIYSPIITLRP